MKKLEIIIRPEKVKLLKAILNESGAHGAMFTRISGYGNQRGKEFSYGGTTYFENIFTKTKVETVVSDEIAEDLIDKILVSVPTGEAGDGKIFVYDVAEAIRIRTGERDKAVI
ncbi:P-II family nitrogen regulator [Eubacterium oxidoreducens]|uniref:Nitrogen regulatory protein P-II family n=1 Tax=Eubacterium oxidoreducens TaxID=1732 RepID=A0A1G6C7C8_EUBOX|nr:P-II family nitrogen regulator [Eubacterium oxidoreducens]SDB28796.1 nitrogen regulatory protein P-II family [Eubacterium oxidoreducens]